MLTVRRKSILPETNIIMLSHHSLALLSWFSKVKSSMSKHKLSILRQWERVQICNVDFDIEFKPFKK